MVLVIETGAFASPSLAGFGWVLGYILIYFIDLF